MLPACAKKKGADALGRTAEVGEGRELLEEAIGLLPDWREGAEKWVMRTKLPRPEWSDQERPVTWAGIPVTLPSSISSPCYLPVGSSLHPSFWPGARSKGLLHSEYLS